MHRDLKPSNVLLAADGPRVIDFGISRAREASMLTQTGTVMGSPGYLSPEQAEGHVVGPPSDVFSLGGVLVFAATGEGPFGSGPTPALMYRVVAKEPNLAQVPDQVRPLIEQCLAKDPADRPTPGELLSQLDALGAGIGVVTPQWLPESFTQAVGKYVPTAVTPTPSAAVKLQDTTPVTPGTPAGLTAVAPAAAAAIAGAVAGEAVADEATAESAVPLTPAGVQVPSAVAEAPPVGDALPVADTPHVAEVPPAAAGARPPRACQPASPGPRPWVPPRRPHRPASRTPGSSPSIRRRAACPSTPARPPSGLSTIPPAVGTPPGGGPAVFAAGPGTAARRHGRRRSRAPASQAPAALASAARASAAPMAADGADGARRRRHAAAQAEPAPPHPARGGRGPHRPGGHRDRPRGERRRPEQVGIGSEPLARRHHLAQPVAVAFPIADTEQEPVPSTQHH